MTIAIFAVCVVTGWIIGRPVALTVCRLADV